MFKPIIAAAAFAAVTIAAAQPASAAYTCGMSADGKQVIVKISNPNPHPISCTINCQFKIPGGSSSVSCTKMVPANTEDFQACVRSTGGDKYTFKSGEEDCVKR